MAVDNNSYISDYVTTGEYSLIVSRDGTHERIVTDVGMADSIRDLYRDDIIGEQVILYHVDGSILRSILTEMTAIVYFRQGGIYYSYSPCLRGKLCVRGVDINLLIEKSSEAITLINITTSIPQCDQNQIKEIYL